MFSKFIGAIFNFIILGMVIAAFFDAMEWATVGWTTLVLLVTAFLLGIIEGKLRGI